MISNIEKGLLEFFEFPIKDENQVIVREKYSPEMAYRWKFENVEIITTSERLKSDYDRSHDGITYEEACDVACVLDGETFTPITHDQASFRLLNKDDTKIVEDFHQACPDIDKEYGQVTIDDELVVGGFVDGELVSIASIWALPEQLADIGIIVKPSAKKKGIGAATVSYLVEQIIDQYIPLYRADFENQGSVKIYQKLGFVPVLRIQKRIV